MLLLAHRGLPAPTRPENTGGAVRAAFDAGADGVEVDVRLTADGVLALSHDPDLVRVAGSPARIAETSWRALVAAAGDADVPLARVEEVLEAAAGRRVVLEVKQPPPGPAAAARTALAVVETLRCLQRAGLPLDVTVSSFAPDVVGQVRRLLPTGAGVRTALLGRPLVRPSALLRQALSAGHDEVHPHVGSVLASPGCVSTSHALGVGVVAWTVNRRRDLRAMARLGVAAVITDVPAAARAALLAAASPAT